MTDRVIIEADGGSRGNPGPASYGALVRDADTGTVIAQRGQVIGIATNNVAEYSGLIAGLEMAREHAPGARVEVRMDSRLVIEQMAGRWKIKHESMRPLASEARRLLPEAVEWTWVPRDQNTAADALANAALDDQESGGSGSVTEPNARRRGPATVAAPAPAPAAGWRGTQGQATTVILLRHGVTRSTERKVFCGSGGTDPGLTETGRRQARRAAEWISRLHIDAVVSSPLQRTRETAAVVAGELGLDVELDAGLAETAFGEWDGHTFAEIQQRWPAELDAWLASSSVAPPGGEPFDTVSERVAAARDRLLQAYAGRTVVAVSHVTPIKLLVRLALDAPVHVIHKMELTPASITTIQWWPDGAASLRNFNVEP